MNYDYADYPQTGREHARRLQRPAARRSAGTAALLSFLWPGFGQAYLRQGLRALVFAVPPLLLIMAAVVYIGRSPETFGLRLLVPTFALGVVALIVIHGVWRVVAIVDAWLSARSTPVSRDRSAPLMVVLSLVVVLAHGFAGYYVQSWNDAGQPIFGGGAGPLDDLVDGTDGPPIPADGPINVVFVGVDSAPGREHSLTDTIMLASFYPERRQVVQISIPRDTGRFPLFDGTVYPNRINSLAGFAGRNPDRYPDGPIGTLVKQVGFLLGVEVHYHAVVNMAGFKEIVDLVGGVDIEVTKPISDPHRKLYLEPGLAHFDGETTLDYVRSRYGPGNSDYERARRQQQVIRALGRRAEDPSIVAGLPRIMRSASELVRTNIPLEQLNELLDLLEEANAADTRQIVLAPKKFAQRIPKSQVGGRFMTELKMDAVADLSMELFDGFSRYSEAEVP